MLLESLKRMWSLPTILRGERQVRPWRRNLIQAVTGAGVHSWGGRTSRWKRKTHEFRLCGVSFLCCTHWESSSFTEAGVIRVCWISTSSRFAAAAVLHASTFIPKCRQDVAAAIWNVEGWKSDWFKGFFVAFSVSSQSFCFFFFMCLWPQATETCFERQGEIEGAEAWRCCTKN